MDNTFDGLPLEGISPQVAAEILRLRQHYSQPKPVQSDIGYDDSHVRFEEIARKRKEAFDKATRQAMIRYEMDQKDYSDRQKAWGAYPGGKTLADILFARPQEPTAKTIRSLLPD
jgi:hypothetical protein